MSLTNPSKQRLLMCIQAVDADDRLLGFVPSWLEEASRQFASVTVFALRVGRYSLPANVEVIPLRPAGSHSKGRVVWTLLKESWLRRSAYDAVFVRGDPHYVLLAGWLWRALGKSVAFWYAHWNVSRSAVLAAMMASVTVTSTKAAFAHPWIRPIVIGQNIDHHRFVGRATPLQGPFRSLILGRVMPSKRIEICVRAFLAATERDALTSLTILGPQPVPEYVTTLHAQFDDHPQVIWGHAPVYETVPTVLHQYDVMLNAYAASLDKSIVEGMMSGLPVLAASRALLEFLPAHLQWMCVQDEAAMTQGLQRLIALSSEERWKLGQELRQIAIHAHSLEGQITRLQRCLIDHGASR